MYIYLWLIIRAFVNFEQRSDVRKWTRPKQYVVEGTKEPGEILAVTGGQNNKMWDIKVLKYIDNIFLSKDIFYISKLKGTGE